jgi:hypothetical protein
VRFNVCALVQAMAILEIYGAGLACMQLAAAVEAWLLPCVCCFTTSLQKHSQHGVTWYRYVGCWAHLQTPEEERKKLLSFVICGGGPTGVEVAAEIHDFVYNDLKVSCLCNWSHQGQFVTSFVILIALICVEVAAEVHDFVYGDLKVSCLCSWGHFGRCVYFLY